MSFFKYYPEAIPGVSVEPFTLTYTLFLFAAVCYIGLVLWIGHNQNDMLRRKTMKYLLVFLVVLEIVNQSWLLLSGSYDVKQHLPIHLCGILIWLMPLWWITKNEFLANFTYYAGLFGALMALLFNYNRAPWFNIQTFQTFLVHSTIFVIPLFNVLYLGFRPTRKYFTRCVLLLMAIATVLYGVNLALGSNYLFLMRSVAKSPLALFEALVGYPGVLLVAFAGIVLLWYLMFIFFDMKLKRESRYIVSQEYVTKAKRTIR